MGLVAFNLLQMLLAVAVPFAVFAVLIHRLEQFTQHRLASRFGWRSVMWTGWLGTPIHELSHAAMCVLFRHRIDDISLFEPDHRAGRLGYVRHSFRHGNWFEELGNFFIGIAPLIGGTVALISLLVLFFPAVADHAFGAVAAVDVVEAEPVGPVPSAGTAQSGETFAGESQGFGQRLVTLVSQICGEIFQVRHLKTGRFWAFLYLVVCVGAHMAPSRSDYQGARRGVLLFAGLLTACLAVLAVLIPSETVLVARTMSYISPVIALLVITVLLCGIVAAAVFVVTSFFPERFTRRED